MQQQSLSRQNTAQSDCLSKQSKYYGLKNQKLLQNFEFQKGNPQNITSQSSITKDKENQAQIDSQSLLEECEEEDALQEHKQVFQQAVKKYSCAFHIEPKGNRNNQKAQNQNQAKIFKQITLDHFLLILLKKLSQMKASLVNFFLSYLKDQKMFYRFLQHIYYTYPNNVAYHAIKYIFLIWELYYNCFKPHSSISQTHIFSKKISNRIYNSQIEAKVYSQSSDNQKKESFKQFIDVLSLTMILIIEKSHSNPWYMSRYKLDNQATQSGSEISNFDCGLHKITKKDSNCYIS